MTPDRAPPPAQAFTEKVVEECATDSDYVWIHDYHLLVMPSLLRKRFNKIRCACQTSLRARCVEQAAAWLAT